MALTLEQYATYLDTRGLLWPEPAKLERPNAEPYLEPLPDVRVVTWNVYGTLLVVSDGQLYFEHPQAFVMEVALEKTIQEFKMWASMSRKPGKPSAYLLEMYRELVGRRQVGSGASGERHPAVRSDEVWEEIVKRLMKNQYEFDVGFYGSLNQYAEKIAYFFHQSLQTPVAYPGTLEALNWLKDQRVASGLIADGQCFTALQLLRALRVQGKVGAVAEVIDPELMALSCFVGGRKPSERLYRAAVAKLTERGINPRQVLHIGPHLQDDLAPARRLGFRTALWAGDKSSLASTVEQLKSKATRPDVLLTEMSQIKEVLGTRF